MIYENKQSTRRKLLTGISAGITLTIAGCTSGDDESDSDESDGNDIQDTDGDGVIDSEDYAPRDPDVQSESDIESETDSTDSEQSESDSQSSDGSTTDDEQDDDSSDSTPPEDVTYPSHSGTHRITARDNYWAWEFSVEAEFSLNYEATNIKDEDYDFDILLYDTPRFEEYRAIANEVREGIRPEYIEGSAPGVTSGVTATDIELPAGTYYLVIDNTDLSDAGDWGAEEPRRVRLVASTGSV